MIIKTYGIYDSVQEEYVRTFTCKNDAEAKRSAAQIVRTPNFDDVTYNDRSIHHLFDLDTSTGVVTNNSINQIFNFSTAIQQRKQDDAEKLVKDKLLTDSFVQEVKDLILLNVKGTLKNEQDSNNN